MSITRRSLNLDFVRDGKGSGLLDPLFTFTRASTATRINASGLLETVAADTPRFDFDPVTLECKGLLIEEGRTNLLTYSTDLTNAAWAPQYAGTGTAPIVTSGFSGPLGLPAFRVRADRGAGTSSGDYSGPVNMVAPQADPHTVTARVWMKSNTGLNQDVMMYCASGAGQIAVTVTNSWQAFTSTATINQTVDQLWIGSRGGVNGTASIDILVAAPQLELGSFATSYIPTTSAAVTRAGDRCYTDNLSPWFNIGEGTAAVDFELTNVVNTVYPRVFDFDNGSSSNYIRLFSYSNYLYAGVASGSGEVAGANWTPVTVGRHKMALRYKVNDFGFVYDGSSVTTDTSGATPIALSRLTLGDDYGGGVGICGHIRRFTYLPFAVDDLTLKQMTV